MNRPRLILRLVTDHEQTTAHPPIGYRKREVTNAPHLSTHVLLWNRASLCFDLQPRRLVSGRPRPGHVITSEAGDDHASYGRRPPAVRETGCSGTPLVF
ncbi:hypothetical protein MRX96_057093 [Rhipicephalus microplus]